MNGTTSNGARWAGRILSGLVSVLFAFDLAIKLLRLPDAVQATVQLGYAESAVPVIGAILLVCLVLYVVPRTALVGAVLLTGYLGGAIASQLRAGGPPFNDVFPLIVAAMVWGGLWLRDPRTHALVSAPRS
jgi:hypothetical protein